MTFMPRKCFEPGGIAYVYLDGKCRVLAPNVAGRIKDSSGRLGMAGEWRDLTWDEVMQKRRDRQAERMERIRHPAEPAILPCYVWTFYVPGEFFTGWYCYVVTRHFEDAVNFRGFDWPLAESIMQEIPCGLLPMKENFNPWMEAFANKYPRNRRWPGGKVFRSGHRDPRKSGVLHGWLKERRIFSLQRPNNL